LPRLAHHPLGFRGVAGRPEPAVVGQRVRQ
jgi:hypothetical protein